MARRTLAAVGVAAVVAAALLLWLRPWDGGPAPSPVPAPPPPRDPAPAVVDLPVEERQRFADAALAESARPLFRRWLESAPGDDGLRTRVLGEALVQRLQQDAAGESDAGLYAEMLAFVLDAAKPAADRAELARVLGETATRPALRSLLDALEGAAPADVRPALADAVARTGLRRWGGRFHVELSPLLEESWAKARDAVVLEALATAMADVGAPSAVGRLVSDAVAGRASIRDVVADGDARVQAALATLPKVRNPDAVAALAPRLNHRAPDDAELVVSGATLAAMGRPEATAALLSWARQAPDGFEGLAGDWFLAMRDGASIGLVNDALAKDPKFVSDKVRDVVQAAAKR
jgi:hypothetical protein